MSRLWGSWEDGSWEDGSCSEMGACGLRLACRQAAFGPPCGGLAWTAALLGADFSCLVNSVSHHQIVP